MNNAGPDKLTAFLKKNGSLIMNIYIAVNFLLFAAFKLYTSMRQGTVDFTLASYTIQTTVLIIFILIRRQHKRIDDNALHQFIALTAFFSGVIFVWLPETGGETEKMISNIIIFTSNILGVFTIINLGRSFGIMIAVREVKTTGLYSFVRHPMYGTDILLRIGFAVSHFNWLSIVLLALSIGCYLYRAVLEERFLSEQEDYRQYMKKVRYRFIPLIF